MCSRAAGTYEDFTDGQKTKDDQLLGRPTTALGS